MDGTNAGAMQQRMEAEWFVQRYAAGMQTNFSPVFGAGADFRQTGRAREEAIMVSDVLGIVALAWVKDEWFLERGELFRIGSREVSTGKGRA